MHLSGKIQKEKLFRKINKKYLSFYLKGLYEDSLWEHKKADNNNKTIILLVIKLYKNNIFA